MHTTIFSLGSATVGSNVMRRREEVGMTRAVLSEALRIGGASDHEVWWLGRLEAGEGIVTVDDLMIIAVALDASPSWLLMPNVGHADDQIWLPGAERQRGWGVATRRRAASVWWWLAGDQPISWEHAEQTFPPMSCTALTRFDGTSRPPWLPPEHVETPGWYRDDPDDDFD